ncbi:hypothetical protein ACFZDF_30565 [Streptomyces sp. NPDC007910]|uniref:hypothetical protein n=1 Tax=Streptomyces sp. NPDC007910 TaxID=3364790 RepID=UPI0036EEF7CF
MPNRAITAAPFIKRELSEPYETLLGGQAAHHLLATAFADVLHPSESRLSPDDLYDLVDALPLNQKAENLLAAIELAPVRPASAAEANRVAKQIVRAARNLGVS